VLEAKDLPLDLPEEVVCIECTQAKLEQAR
jgi:hypothetical protein